MARDNLGDKHLYWKIMLKLILEKYDITIWERTFSFHKSRKFLDQVSSSEVVMKKAPWSYSSNRLK